MTVRRIVGHEPALLLLFLRRLPEPSRALKQGCVQALFVCVWGLILGMVGGDNPRDIPTLFFEVRVDIRINAKRNTMGFFTKNRTDGQTYDGQGDARRGIADNVFVNLETGWLVHR